MPRRNDLHRILIIGSGPIVIGQACEFDYSGTQAAKALRADGYEVILVNSNPATIMTDPGSGRPHLRRAAQPRAISKRSSRRERPDALLSTVGGQTGLNLSVELAEAGVLDSYGVELIGAKIDAIKKAEDRLLFKDAMRKIGLETPHSQLVTDVEGGLDFAAKHRLSRAFCAPVSRWAAPAAASPTTAKIWSTILERGLDAFAGARSADRRERARLEGIRAGGDARSRRQRHHRLLHRKFRSHGRAHRRFHHRRARRRRSPIANIR